MAEQDRTSAESDDRATGMPAAAEPTVGSAVQRTGPTSGSTRRPGCLLVGIAGAVGALIGALTAGLLLVIVLAGDDSPDTAVPTAVAPEQAADDSDAAGDNDASSPDASTAVAVSTEGGTSDVQPPEGSTGDADFWSQVLANSNLFGTAPDGESGSGGDGAIDLSPDLLADIWAQMLAGESSDPGAPLGSRIEGINIKAVLEEVQESVVIVNAPTAENPGRGGSGFVVAADGRIVTNEHVVRDAETVQVRLFGGELLSAEVVASDPTRDLAVLKVDRDGLPAVRLGSTEGVEVGDEVIAIGNALGIVGEPTVTSGIVSGLNRDITLRDGTRLVRLIQTDAAINLGNSGGPLVNAAGEVIGVNTAIPALSSTSRGIAEGIGYAISIDHARQIIDQLLEGVVQAKAYLGVRVTSVEDFIAANESPEDDPSGGLGDGGPETIEPGPEPDGPFADIELLPEVTSGALVVGVDPGEAADRAGIEPGDVIVEFEGAEILTSNDLVVEILARLPGDRVEMGVIGNDGKLRKVELVLGSFVPDDTEG